MNKQFDQSIKTYKNKLTRVLKNFLFDTQIFSIKKINILDIDINLDLNNRLIKVKESENATQIDVLVIDIEKFKDILYSFFKKPKDSNIEKFTDVCNKIDKKVLQIISQQIFCIFSYHEYAALMYEEDKNKNIDILNERDKFSYYLLENLLSSFNSRRNFVSNNYLYVFSEKESIKEVVNNHFENIFYIDKLHLYNYKNQIDCRMAVILYLRSWTEILNHDHKNNKKSKNRYGDKVNNVNIISTKDKINKIYCFRSFSRTYKRRSSSKYKYSVSSYIDMYVSVSDKQLLVENIFKYLNKNKQYINKETLEIINPRIQGEENIYFTQNDEISYVYCNSGRFTLRFSAGNLVF